MKTLLKLVATALLSWAATAPALAAPPANLNIVSERGQPFGLVLDGRPLTRPVARQVHVDLLTPGQHWADISVPTPYGPAMRFRTALWLQPGLETSFVLVMRRSGPQLRQVGAVAMGGPGYGQGGGYYGGQGGQGGYYGNGDQGGYPGGGQYSNGNPGDYGNVPVPSNPAGGYPAPGNPAGGYNPVGGYPAPGNPTGGYNPAGGPGGNNNPSGYPAPGGGYYPGSTIATNLRPLSPDEASNLTQALRQRAFDEERLNIAKQALSQNSVRATDLSELIKTLSFDKSRIELAKFGYAHVADPQNFYRVYDALQFSSSVREVQEAIGVPTR